MLRAAAAPSLNVPAHRSSPASVTRSNSSPRRRSCWFIAGSRVGGPAVLALARDAGEAGARPGRKSSLEDAHVAEVAPEQAGSHGHSRLGAVAVDDHGVGPLQPRHAFGRYLAGGIARQVDGVGDVTLGVGQLGAGIGDDHVGLASQWYP